MADDIWARERRLWLEGEAAYGELMDMRAVMVFPVPPRILVDGRIAAAMRDAPRWSEVTFSEEVMHELDGVTILVYRALARRDGDAPYVAVCSSVWQKAGDAPLLVLHQQTPET